MSTENEPTRTEADAIAEHSAAPLLLTPTGEDGALITEQLPPGWTSKHTVLDGERYQECPRRHRGTTTTQDGASFAQVVADQRLDELEYEPRVYALELDQSVTAVLNQGQGDITGWGDYRVALKLRRTVEWEAWLNGQGLKKQAPFADFIEEHLEEIVGPDEAYPNLLPAADLLEMAQHFQLHQSAQFKRSEKLQDGQVQLTYEETNEASAGKSGQLTIPEEIHVVLRPFVGSDIYRIKARLRYRVNGGELGIGYKLIRPDDTEREVFTDELTKIEAALELPIVRGSVPSLA